MTEEEINNLKIDDYVKLTNNRGNIIYCYKIIGIKYNIDEYSIKLIYRNDGFNKNSLNSLYTIKKIDIQYERLSPLTDEEKVELL